MTNRQAQQLDFIARTLARYIALSEQSFYGYKPSVDYANLRYAKQLAAELYRDCNIQQWRDSIASNS
jgi:hypothetical protein